MAPTGDGDDDWSDSDDEVLPEIETSVLLGVPDGPIESPADLKDVAVSRIGGLPALLSSAIPFESSQCKSCDSAMELLVQMWSPFENSAYDRALYVWACPKSGCQKNDLSVRAWRGLRYNEEYAKKLKRKDARRQEQQHTKVLSESPARGDAAQTHIPKANPFAMNAGATASAPLGLGSDIFGHAGATSAPVELSSSDTDTDDDSSVSSSTPSLIVALASTTLSETPWASAPTYPPQYLSTLSEYLPAPRKDKLPAPEAEPAEGRPAKGDLWASEKYENSLDTDQVFDRFNRRVAAEPQQCVRYELGGAPLPFASDAVYERLFPQPHAEPAPTIVSKADFKVTPAAPRRAYDPAQAVPACAHCGAPRVFECQLMPNLINVLKPDGVQSKAALTDEERRKEVERVLKGGAAGADVRGMDWGTILVFSCERDCCLAPDGKGAAKEGWKEEFVLVHWDA
ncbi:hypothetical protein FA95DRAFT_1544948 [Auriscalpium vulgare]|uniref:Uncharacterized protein n=1 Tax=Auriscalpium vulgare TaxID=40419 RepID=A0ACB8RL46_9AGAM|nr:hypothetical protein FA95DRAFT_1544948 [Auriscalpium vulgare]